MPALRVLVVVALALSLIFYAQYESGLPAFAYRALNISPEMMGAAIAPNAILRRC